MPLNQIRSGQPGLGTIRVWEKNPDNHNERQLGGQCIGVCFAAPVETTPLNAPLEREYGRDQVSRGGNKRRSRVICIAST